MDAFAGEERGGDVVVVCAVQKKGKKHRHKITDFNVIQHKSINDY